MATRSSKKNIVIIGTAHPYRGGLANYNERLARAYAEQGHQVRLFTFTLQYPALLFPGKTQYSDEPAPKNLNIIRAINAINPINWYRVGKRIRALRPDLVVVKFWLPFMGPCLGTLARLIRKNGHSRVVSIIDNIVPHEKGPADRLLANYFVRSVDGFVTMSDAVMQDLLTFDTQKPKRFNPHPVYDNFGEPISRDAALKDLNLDPDWKYLLFFGFIRDYKGLDLLLKAMACKAVRDQKIKLIVAGEFYSKPDPYLNLIEELQLSDRVVMATDFIPDSRVKYYFCAADLVVQPYKTATQSGVTQIAYHFLKPMVVTDVGGLKEIVPHEKTGYVVDPEEQQIAHAIHRFFNEADSEFMQQHLIQEKKKYSWEQLLKTLDDLLDQMDAAKVQKD